MVLSFLTIYYIYNLFIQKFQKGNSSATTTMPSLAPWSIKNNFGRPIIVISCCWFNNLVMNQCSHPVWSVAISNPGTPLLPPNINDFVNLQPGQSTTISISPFWSGSIWGRTRCSMEDLGLGKFYCLTEDWGSDMV